MGEVADSRKFLEQLDVLIVPLWAGSGVRIKILEAMALGVPVVGTAIAYEGIAVSHMHSGWIADDSDSWIKGIDHVLRHTTLSTKIVKAAQDLIRNEYDIDHLSKLIASEVSTLINTEGVI